MSKKNVTRKAGSAKSGIASGSPMDVGLLQQIVRLMSDNDLNTVDVRDGEKRVILKRGVAAAAAPHASAGYAPPYLPALAAPPAGLASGAAIGTPALPADENAGLVPIKSPMVGTFYAASSPDAQPFVEVGSQVDEESDVCIIEAMKVFNNIKAECRGTIAKILVTNGQTVEFGQVLLMVKPR